MGEIKLRRGRARTGEEGFTLLENVAVHLLVD